MFPTLSTANANAAPIHFRKKTASCAVRCKTYSKLFETVILHDAVYLSPVPILRLSISLRDSAATLFLTSKVLCHTVVASCLDYHLDALVISYQVRVCLHCRLARL
jgi:hypothetical protein